MEEFVGFAFVRVQALAEPVESGGMGGGEEF